MDGMISFLIHFPMDIYQTHRKPYFDRRDSRETWSITEKLLDIEIHNFSEASFFRVKFKLPDTNNFLIYHNKMRTLNSSCAEKILLPLCNSSKRN